MTSMNELLQRLQICQNAIVEMEMDLWPKQKILEQILRTNWEEEYYQESFWRDVLDHIVTMLNTLEIGSKTLEGLQNVFLARASLELSNQSHTLNKVAQKFGVIASLFLPMTCITGMWGMNCPVPFQSGSAVKETNLLPFFMIGAFFVILSISMLIWFRSNRFI